MDSRREAPSDVYSPTSGHRLSQAAASACAAAAAMEPFKLVSPAFHNGERIPRKYTGEGPIPLRDVSPPLEWYGVPGGAKSLALVVEDVDAPDPGGPIVPWTHWVVVNIPPEMKGLPEGFSGRDDDQEGPGRNHRGGGGVVEGNNDWKQPGWRGPKAPTGGHRYRFTLFALDELVHLGHKVTKEKLLDSINGGGHVLGEAELVGIF